MRAAQEDIDKIERQQERLLEEWLDRTPAEREARRERIRRRGQGWHPSLPKWKVAA